MDQDCAELLPEADVMTSGAERNRTYSTLSYETKPDPLGVVPSVWVMRFGLVLMS